MKEESLPTKKHSKATASKFISDAKRMEISIYTLRSIAQACRAKAATVLKNAKSELQAQTQQIENTSTALEVAKFSDTELSQKKPTVKKAKFMKAFLWALVISIGTTGGIWDWNIVKNNLTLTEVICYIFPVILCLTTYVFYKVYCWGIKEENADAKKAYDTSQLERKELIASLEKKENNQKAKKEKCVKELARAQYVSNQLQLQASECDRRADEINAILQECYIKTNIVPPDYRFIDCIIVLDHVFRNDLADTVRDAIFYYEEKKFRELVVRGVNDIFVMLQNMANVLYDVKDLLQNIDLQTATLSNDVQAIAAQQYESNVLQRENIAINKARKYADEAFYASQICHNEYVKRHL